MAWYHFDSILILNRNFFLRNMYMLNWCSKCITIWRRNLLRIRNTPSWWYHYLIITNMWRICYKEVWWDTNIFHERYLKPFNTQDKAVSPLFLKMYVHNIESRQCYIGSTRSIQVGHAVWFLPCIHQFMACYKIHNLSHRYFLSIPARLLLLHFALISAWLG